MPMLNWLNKLSRHEGGNAVVEFALILPFMLLLFSGLTEIGRAYFQANAVEKGLRAAALYASRAPTPLSAADQVIAENILRTGTSDGAGPVLVSGWAKPGASVTITSTNYDLSGVNVPVVRVDASVPLDPLVPELLTLVGLNTFTIDLSHEQAYVGQ